jgi:tRNA nucleotidyltransferase/poly(A) polymerase
VNIEQSKRLETACFSVSRLRINVANLRAEGNSIGSTSSARFGTAQEDASLRDFTLNALFYNLQTEKVEDYVGGLMDLSGGLLRTPQRADKTLRDDPLRILRAIRFATAYGFTIHPDLHSAARVVGTGDLTAKVSRDRIGIETNKMLGNGLDRGVAALDLIWKLGLHNDVFLFEFWEGDPRNPGLRAPQDPCHRLAGLDDPAQARIALYATYLSPLSGQSSPFVGKNLMKVVLEEGLKLSKDESQRVTRVLDGAEMLRTVRSDHRLLDVGQALLRTKEDWVVAWRVAEALGWYEADLFAFVREGGLDGCWKWRPAFDGWELQKTFGFHPGPEIGAAIESQICWRLDNPLASLEEQRAAFKARHPLHAPLGSS